MRGLEFGVAFGSIHLSTTERREEKKKKREAVACCAAGFMSRPAQRLRAITREPGTSERKRGRGTFSWIRLRAQGRWRRPGYLCPAGRTTKRKKERASSLRSKAVGPALSEASLRFSTGSVTHGRGKKRGHGRRRHTRHGGGGRPPEGGLSCTAPVGGGRRRGRQMHPSICAYSGNLPALHRIPSGYSRGTEKKEKRKTDSPLPRVGMPVYSSSPPPMEKEKRRIALDELYRALSPTCGLD